MTAENDTAGVDHSEPAVLEADEVASAELTKAGTRRKRTAPDPNAPPGDVIINLLVDPLWRHLIKRGFEEHFGRFGASDKQPVLIASPNLAYFVAPAIEYVQSRGYTGDKLMDEVENAFEYTTLKEGSVQISREWADTMLTPCLQAMKSSYTRADGFRWSVRFLVVASMYLYAAFLIRNQRRETKYLTPTANSLTAP